MDPQKSSLSISESRLLFVSSALHSGKLTDKVMAPPGLATCGGF